MPPNGLRKQVFNIYIYRFSSFLCLYRVSEFRNRYCTWVLICIFPQLSYTHTHIYIYIWIDSFSLTEGMLQDVKGQGEAATSKQEVGPGCAIHLWWFNGIYRCYHTVKNIWCVCVFYIYIYIYIYKFTYVP